MMSFLRRLLGKPDSAEPRERPPGPITDWSDASIDRLIHRVAFIDPSPHTLRVVGASQYQGTLEYIAAGGR